MRIRQFSCAALVITTLSGCDDGYLRGSVERSPDGNTYLAIVDDNAGCSPIMVDGAVWEHEIGEPALISPGTHIVECGTGSSFVIPQGVIFKFDYWGP